MICLCTVCAVSCSKSANHENSPNAESSQNAKTAQTAETTCSKALFQEQCVGVGDIVTFGKYPQATHEPEAISWRVLDVDSTNRKMLLLSEYVLDAKPYNTSYTSITWEKCTLRTWLNGTFKTTAFTSSEQQFILQTPLTNPNNPNYGTVGGNDTYDDVFLLALADATNTAYFADNAVRMALATKYAIINGICAFKPSIDVRRCVNVQCSALWWLRSPGSKSNRTAEVDDEGFVDYEGGDVTGKAIGVRPALWVNY